MGYRNFICHRTRALHLVWTLLAEVGYLWKVITGRITTLRLHIDLWATGRSWTIHWGEIVSMQGHCCKICNYDYIDRLAFRIFFSQRSIQISSVNVLHSVTNYSLIVHKPSKIVNDLRLFISLETNLVCYTENFVNPALYEVRTDN